MNTKTLIRIALLGAIGWLLMFLEFPILPSANFLRLNFCDIPALLAAFSMGPLAGFSVVVIENVLHFIAGSFSGGIGEFANILISGTLAVVAGNFYRNFHTKKGAFLALCLASVLMIIMALFANRYLLLPMYLKNVPSSAFTQMLITAILPFNAIKAVIITTITMFLYKPLSPLLKTAKKQ